MKSILILLLAVGMLNAKFIRDNNQDMVLDTQTNLVWQDDSDSSTITKSWSDAIAYCEALTLGGYTTWYLPNFNELYYLGNREKFSPAINDGFLNVSKDNYWSSTTYIDNSGVWSINFNNGKSTKSDKNLEYYIKCVRYK